MEPMESATLDSNRSVVVMGTASSSVSPPGVDTMGRMLSSPCAGCKFLRRKCQPDCVFAPYFPADQPDRFISVHKSFGASNVTKILNDLHPEEQEFAVASLIYEANWRMHDQVNGCINDIHVFEERLNELRFHLSVSVAEMYSYKAVLERLTDENQVSLGIEMEQMHSPVWQQQQQLQHLQQQQRMMMMMMGGNGAMVEEAGVGGRTFDPDLAEVMDASAAAFDGQFAGFSAAEHGRHNL